MSDILLGAVLRRIKAWVIPDDEMDLSICVMYSAGPAVSERGRQARYQRHGTDAGPYVTPRTRAERRAKGWRA